jgi:hypothetical protein
MAAIKDLEPCSYLPRLGRPTLLAIGWLERHSEFMRGSSSPEFFRKLCELCANPWEPVASAGHHQCSLCQFEPPAFGGNVFIPHQGYIYVAPVGVVHYIAAHWYLPPQAFIQAVLACPPMRSLEYHKALLANGGRNLIKPSAA